MKIYIDAINPFLKNTVNWINISIKQQKNQKNITDIQKVFMIVPLESIVISILTHPSNLSHDLVLER